MTDEQAQAEGHRVIEALATGIAFIAARTSVSRAREVINSVLDELAKVEKAMNQEMS